MTNKQEALQKELTRIRSLKRAAESEVELLRSDMERGLIHIRINPDIKPQIADALCEIYTLGYDDSIHVNYFTDGEMIYEEKARAAFHNWGWVDFKIKSLRNLMDEKGRYASWDKFNDNDLISILGESSGNLLAEMKSNPSFKKYTIEMFLKEQHPDLWKKIIEEQRAIAYDFFWGEIPDEYIISIQ